MNDLNVNLEQPHNDQSLRAWGDGISGDTFKETHYYITFGFIPSVM